MKFNLYSIKDELSEFMPPLPFQEDEQAIRYFNYRMVNEKMLADNPSDFSIWKVGGFDSNKGTTTGLKSPVLLERGTSVYGNKETIQDTN